MFFLRIFPKMRKKTNEFELELNDSKEEKAPDESSEDISDV